jgi:integration host factor subunit beta
MATITKKRLIQVISQKRGIHPNEVRNVIQSFLDEMTDSLAHGDRLEFRDFGVFEVVVRKQKIGRNPKNAGVPIVIPARSAVKFIPGKKMRSLIERGPSSSPSPSKPSLPPHPPTPPFKSPNFS